MNEKNWGNCRLGLTFLNKLIASGKVYKSGDKMWQWREIVLIGNFFSESIKAKKVTVAVAKGKEGESYGEGRNERGGRK